MKGVSAVPSTSSRTSLIQVRRGPAVPMPPLIGRVAHMPPMPFWPAGGAGSSSGAGASQFGRVQTVPSGASVRRRSWLVARATLTPPLMNSASTTLMRFPSRTTRVAISIGEKSGRRYMSTVRRAGMKSGSPNLCSISKASRPTITRPCRDWGFQGPRLTGLATYPAPSRLKKASFSIVADHGGFAP